MGKYEITFGDNPQLPAREKMHLKFDVDGLVGGVYVRANGKKAVYFSAETGDIKVWDHNNGEWVTVKNLSSGMLS